MDYIIRYNAVNNFYKQLNNISDKIKDEKIVIFGTNKISGMIQHYLYEKGIDICAFVDNDKSRQGIKIWNKQVCSPENVIEKYDKCKFLIVSGHQESMVKQLLELGVNREDIVVVIDLNKEMASFSYSDYEKKYEEVKETEYKAILLENIKYFKKVCEENQIRYYLSGGTMLGAVRHRGFIPWDDDIDVFVVLDDIPKLINVMKEDKNYTFISMFDKESNYFDEVSLFVNNNYICDSNHFPVQMTMGASIDVFYLSGVPEDENEYVEYALKAKELEQEKWNYYYSENECRNRANKVVDFLSKIPFGSTKYIGSVLSPHFLRERFRFDSFEKFIYEDFEDEKFRIPSDYNEYLTQIYGENYMTPPAISERKGHHSFKLYKKIQEISK